jgi:ribonuclease Z
MACVALWREGRVFLFDCGENAQMRMLQAGMKRSKIDYIFISHLDGDHYFGLLGLLSTFQTQKRDKGLVIVGPPGIKKFVETNLELAHISVDYGLTINELDAKAELQIVVDEPDFYVEARPLDHNTAEAKKFCVGYRFQEKDKPGKVDASRAVELGITEDWQFKSLKSGQDVKLENGETVRAIDIVGSPRPGHSFAYITDTRYCENSVELARNATLLYHEATFDTALKDKAEETGHSTAEIAATVAAQAQAQRLLLGHFSARYTNEFTLMKEARLVFQESWIAIELRPIMTDPEHEKGIIKAKVEIQMPQAAKKKVRRVAPKGGRRPFGRPGGDRRPYGRPGDRPSYGDRRPYGDRPSYPPRERSYGDRPSYPPRERSYGDRPSYSSDRPSYPPRERSYGDRPQYSSDRPQYPPRERSFGDRPPYNPDRPSYPPRERSFGDRPQYSSDRPSYPPRERSYGDRPPYNPDRPSYPPRERSYGDRPSYSSDRPQYGSDRPSYPPRTGDDYNRTPRQDDDQNRPITPRTSGDDFSRRI